MKRTAITWTIALAVAALSLARPAAAADIPKAVDPSKVASAGEMPKPGDNFLFRQPLNVFQAYDPQAPTAPSKPPFSCTHNDAWAKILSVPAAGDNNYYVIFPSERWYELKVNRGGIPGLSLSNPPKDAARNPTDACAGDNQVRNDVVYKFDKSILDKIDVARFGPTYGALVVPFKFHFSDHTLDASSAVLGYFGYEGWLIGGSSAIFLAGGMSAVNIPTPEGAAGTGSNTTKAALTAGVGVNWTFGTTSLWKGGVLIGWDWAGKNVGYPYEHKPWLAVSLGIGF